MTAPLPLAAYQDLIRSGTLSPDPAQEEAAKKLDALAKALNGYRPGATTRRGLFRKRTVAAPRGLYLYGTVGVGKSLLMDLFFEGAPVGAKRRVHFHAFMQETHRFIADWRGMTDAAREDHPAREEDAPLDDPIPHAAKAILNEAHLLCFDEVQVTDITDAMLLGRLFERLFAEGVVLVATSNRHPTDLYKNGINRELFTPFIDLIEAHMETLELKGQKDYRLDRLEGSKVYFSPLGKDADDAMNAVWQKMTAGAAAERLVLKSGSREVVIPCVARGVGRGSFEHFCGQPLGPQDYLLIAAEFGVLFLDDIPLLTEASRNEAKRFVTLIDALYEARCTLVCSADAAPDALYPSGDGAFEFRRTASRLHEMQSEDYLAQSHRGAVPA